jgi:excisionase family DNA binding protein
MTPDTPQYLTQKQAAERAGVHIRTVARWLADGTLTKHTRRGSRRARVVIQTLELDRITGRDIPVTDEEKSVTP